MQLAPKPTAFAVTAPLLACKLVCPRRWTCSCAGLAAALGVVFGGLAASCRRDDKVELTAATLVTSQALSLVIVPASLAAADDTADALAGLLADDSVLDNPDTLSAVSTTDNVYTVGRNNTAQIDTFDVSTIPAGATITGVVLHLQYGAENGFTGTSAVEYDNGAGFVATSIVPADILSFSPDLTFDLFAAGVTSRAQIANLDLRFVNNDGGAANAVHFDYVRIVVTGALVLPTVVARVSTSVPAVAAPAPARRVKAVTAGGSHTCAVFADGSVACFGANATGALGQGDTTTRGDNPGESGESLLPVSLGTDRSAIAVAAGSDYTCALLDEGSVKCWGGNAYGQLGQGDTARRGDNVEEMGDSLLPVALGIGRRATAIVAGSWHVCALLEGGALKCWGRNDNGQLGLEDGFHRGQGAATMGDNLLPVSLGAGRTAIDVAAGEDHTCAVLDNGAVKCWGGNIAGQLGQGDSAQRGDNVGQMGDNLSPVGLGTGRTATAVTAAYWHTCAVLDDGAAKCWGYNLYADLGQGDAEWRGDDPGEMGDSLAPVRLGTARLVTAVTVGSHYTCGLLDDGAVKCWGLNTYGQLGQGDKITRGWVPGDMGDNLLPVDLGAGRTATAVEAGGAHVCAVLDDGTLKCWGRNIVGQLGQGDNADRGDGAGELGDDLPPVAVGSILRVACSFSDPDAPPVAAFDVTIAARQPDDATVITLCAAASHGEACDAGVGAGVLVVAGSNPYTATVGWNVPVAFPAGAYDFECSAAEALFGGAAGTSSFGANLDLVAVGAGPPGPFAITSVAGDVSPPYVDNADEAPNVTTLLFSAPGAAACRWALTDVPYAAMVNACSSATSCAVTGASSELVAYVAYVACTDGGGHDSDAWSNLNVHWRNYFSPAPTTGAGVTPSVSSFETTRPTLAATGVAIGGFHVCALFGDGGVKCWGLNDKGQLGQGDTATRGDAAGELGDRLWPISLGTGRTATAVAAGIFHTCVLLDDGSVKCWGGNTAGQLGQGNTRQLGDHAGEMGDDLPPVNLGAGRTATAVAAGGEHTCALLDGGAVKCWGDNATGQLGQGDAVDRGWGAGDMGDNLLPVSLGTGRTATAVAVGWEHTCAALDDGSLKCWGDNAGGQLGQGDVLTRGDQAGEMGDTLLPVSLGAGRTAAAVTAGGLHTCALLDDGSVKCWGDSVYGQLGQGDVLTRGDQVGEMGDTLLPVSLGAGRTVTAIAVGFVHTCALLDDGTVKCWGFNAYGELGQGATGNLGDAPGELGDNLLPVSLGTGRTATKIVAGGNDTVSRGNNACAVLDDGSVKCWGGNSYGQLGQGDTLTRGDGAGELGDSLSAVALGSALRVACTFSDPDMPPPASFDVTIKARHPDDATLVTLCAARSHGEACDAAVGAGVLAVAGANPYTATIAWQVPTTYPAGGYDFECTVVDTYFGGPSATSTFATNADLVDVASAPGPFTVVSVAGDASAPYVDASDDAPNRTVVVFTAPGAVACRWASADLGYAAMVSACSSATSCTFSGATSDQTSYAYAIACVDAGGRGNDRWSNLEVAWENRFGAACVPSGADDDCDGVDDDCDGAADDEYVPQPTSCGVGACTRTGTSACVAGVLQQSCSPGLPAADDAACDGQDDDCDGFIDEEVQLTTSCPPPADACDIVVCSPRSGTCEASGISLCCSSDSDCDPGSACLVGGCNQDRCTYETPALCCRSAADCADAGVCTDTGCDVATGVCSRVWQVGCCEANADCDDGDSCSYDECTAEHRCQHQPATCATVGPCGGDVTCIYSAAHVALGRASPEGALITGASGGPVLALDLANDALAGTLSGLSLEVVGLDRGSPHFEPRFSLYLDGDGDGRIDAGSEPVAAAGLDAGESPRVSFASFAVALAPASTTHWLVALELARQPGGLAAGAFAAPWILGLAGALAVRRRRWSRLALALALVAVAAWACGRVGFDVGDVRVQVSVAGNDDMSIDGGPGRFILVQGAPVVGHPFVVRW
ncbi:MAG: hypothetical protein HY903_07820 [Deltaproteobacteria bacterium]|nr:hypothetical protein [Deltaproteobacteria bacterium]